MCVCVYIYIYIYRERERDTHTHTHTHVILALTKIRIYSTIRDGNFAPPLPASLRAGFSRPAKVMGSGMGRDFRPAPWGRTGMGLHFLDPPRPALIRVKL